MLGQIHADEEGVGMKLIKGQKIFWRWKGRQSPYLEQVVMEQNGKMIALADNAYSSFASWFNEDDIDLFVKDMSKEVA